ncbi:MAG: phage late control D family protein [Novosphingobium sp.]|nr:phage late control D family protein [Novosphingobium sp.]
MQDNCATFTLDVNGIDYAKVIIPRLVSLSLTEKLEDGADELEVTLANHDGQLAPINRGAFATVALGWEAGRDVPIGLVAKGRFKVDEVRKQGGASGEADTLTIRARSADLTGDYRRRRDRGWKDTTIGAVVREVAGANGYAVRVHPDLDSLPVDSLEQASKSDMAFIRDIGRRYDAVATVKDKTLLFLPIGSETNASGQMLASQTLKRAAGSHWTFTVADREDHDGAEAQWHDRGEAKRKTVQQGKASNPKRIKRTFASEAEAKAAASAEAKRAERGAMTFSYDMALGDASIEPNTRVTLDGWDSEIDGVTWLVTEVRHQLDGQGGFTTSVQMESLA